MLNSIFTKSLYEKRWSTVAWVIAIIGMTALVTLLFPTFKDTLGQSLQQVPDSLKAFLGDASTYQTLGGYVDVQVIAQMVFMTIIMGVIFGSGYIAGDEGDGTLQSLLAQPVSRRRVYIQKYAASIIVTIIGSISMFIAVYLSALVIHESMDWWRMAQATFAIWLITFVFASSAFSLGAITGRRGLSGSFIGMLAFMSYLITSLAVGIKSLRTVDTLSPFHYFNTPVVIKNGIDWGNVAVLVVIIIIVSVVGYLRFTKRDITAK